MKTARKNRRRLNSMFFSAAAVAAATASASLANGGVLYDDITPFEDGTSTGGFTVSAPYTFVGAAFNLASGTSGAPTSLTGFDVVGLNDSTQTFTAVEVVVYFWGTVNTGTVNSSHPAFSNSLGTSAIALSAADLGDASTGITPVSTTAASSGSDFIDLEYTGTEPAIVFGTPLALNGSTQVGVTVEMLGSTDGTNFATYPGLGVCPSYESPASTGSIAKSGYYGNSVATDTNGNFTSKIKTFSGDAANDSILMRLFGTFPAVNYQWNSPSGGNWESTTSWNPNTPLGGPTDSDNANFNLSSSAGYTVGINSADDTCNNLNVENDNVTLAISSSETANLSVISNITVGQPPTASSTGTTVGTLGLTSPQYGTVGVEANNIVVGPTNGIGHLTVGNGVVLSSNFNVSVGAGSTAVVANGGVLEADQVIVNGTLTIQSGGILSCNNLTLAGSTNQWTGKVDITDGFLDLPGGNLATVTNQVAEAYNLTGGANWNGPGGITSSEAASDTSHLTAVGVIQNNQGGGAIYGASGTISTFGVFTPDVGDILVRYTYFGDANLDGVVDGSDYSLIDAGYAADQAVPGSATGWYNGDFNYDGTVDGSDYTLIDNAYNNQGNGDVENLQGQVVVADALSSPATVPEPATGSALVAGASVVAAVRRRRRR